jgi:bacillithiol biosynthesis cysteine-adding enzyme BshC
MQCTCVRQTDLPNTSKLFTDLIYRFDRVKDFYPFRPNDLAALEQAAKFTFPDARRAALVEAIRPLNEGNPSLHTLAQPGTVVVVSGQQVGLFLGPAYTIYKALTAIRIAHELRERGIPAVPMFWLATEDHDFAEVNHTWVFGPGHSPVKLELKPEDLTGTRPVGGIPLGDVPVAELRSALAGLPFADEAVAMAERAYKPGASKSVTTMGSAFASMISELFSPWGLLLVDPMLPAIRQIAAPLMKEAVERMPELADALIARSGELRHRGYHSQVLVDGRTSLAFLLENGQRIALRRSNGEFVAPHRKWSSAELADRAAELSPNALLRPVVQDYLLPTAAYVGGPAELAYLAQSQVLYQKLLGRQPVAFPRAGFTLLDERSAKRMVKYRLNPVDLFCNQPALRDTLASRLVPLELKHHLDRTRATVASALDDLGGELQRFDITLAAALDTSRRKIEYQVAKIARKSAAQILAKDAQAQRDALSLHGLVFPEGHLQERLYSMVPFLAKFGPSLIGDLYSQVRLECPDHQFVVV